MKTLKRCRSFWAGAFFPRPRFSPRALPGIQSVRGSSRGWAMGRGVWLRPLSAVAPQTAGPSQQSLVTGDLWESPGEPELSRLPPHPQLE